MKINGIKLVYDTQVVQAELDVDQRILVSRNVIPLHIALLVDFGWEIDSVKCIYSSNISGPMDYILEVLDIIRKICISNKEALLHKNHSIIEISKISKIKLNHFPDHEISFEKSSTEENELPF